MRKNTPEDFWRFVLKTESCWLWQGSKKRHGYGLFRLGGRRQHTTHRLSYEMSIGPIPDGGHILHSCDNTSCVNPAHLRVGTHLDNIRDKMERRRHASFRRTKCPKGHPYAVAILGPDGVKKRRRCRECVASSRKARYERDRKARLNGVLT